MRRVWTVRARILVTALALVMSLSAITSARTVVRLVTYFDPEGWQAIADEFNASQSEIQLEPEIYVYADYIDKVTAMMASGNPPDVLQTWAQYKPLWVKQHVIQDLTDRWERSDVVQSAELYPFVREMAMLDGRYWGIPWDYNAQVWYLNRDWMNQRGVAEPDENWTVKDLREMAQKLTDPQAQIYGINNPVGGAVPTIQWMKNWSGAGWLNENRTDVTVNSAGAVDMLRYWQDLLYQYEVGPTPGSFAPKANTWNGGYAMWQGWIGGAHRFPEDGYDWGVALFPKAPMGQKDFAQGHMMSIPVGAKNPDASWKVLEWLMSSQGQEAVVKYHGRQPLGPNPDLWVTHFNKLPPEKRQPVRDWVVNVLYGNDYIDNYTYDATYPEMSAIMSEHLNAIFNERKSPQNEMNDAARQMRAILAQ